MFKKTLLLALTACFFAFLFQGCTRRETVVPLSEQEISEAIAFGAEKSDLSETELMEEWTKQSGPFMRGEAVVTLVTPFLRTALLSKRAAGMGRAIDMRMLNSLLSREADYLHFDVILYGETFGFGRTAQFILYHDGVFHEPARYFMPSYADMGRDYTCIAKGWIKFHSEHIPADAEVRLNIRFQQSEHSEEISEIDMVFDLAEFR